MLNEDEIVYLFKILLIGLDEALHDTWKELKIESIPESENIVEGVRFGVKNYLIPIENKNMGTKIFFCAFNPISINPELRKSYYRGTNGVLISVNTDYNLTNLKESIDSILEVNKDVLPIVNIAFTGTEDNLAKIDVFIKNEMESKANQLSLNQIEQKTGYKSVNVSKLKNNLYEDVVTDQVTELIKRIM
jgi:hypothetical protein